MGDSIVTTLMEDGIHGLSLDQLDWIPTPLTYAERRAALENKIQPLLDRVKAEIPADITKEVDNDFLAMLDDGGRGKTPTTRPGLLKKLMNWMWGEQESGSVLELNIEKVAVGANGENIESR